MKAISLLLSLAISSSCLYGQLSLYSDDGNLIDPRATSTSSNGYIIASLEDCYTPGSTTIEGCTYAVNVIKTDSQGDTIWTTKSSYFYTQVDPNLQVFENTDGSVTVFVRVPDNTFCNGQWGTFPTSNWYRIEVMNFNSDGSIQSRFHFEDECSLWYSSIKKLDDDNYLILARHSQYTGSSNYYYESRLFKMDKNGEIIHFYSRPYDSVLGRGEVFFDALGEILVFSINQADELILDRFDEELNHLSTQVSEVGVDVCEGLSGSAQKFQYTQYENGDIVVGCRNHLDFTAPSSLYTFTRLTSDLELIQQRTYELGRSTNFIEMTSGESLICSYYRLDGVFRELRITRFDQNLDSVASNSIFMEEDTRATALLKTVDERLAIVGFYGCCNGLESPAQAFLMLQDDLTPVVDTDEEEFFFRLLPNPTSGVVKVETQSIDRFFQYQIFNLNGELVKSGNISTHNEDIDISNFVAGVYFMTVFNETGASIDTRKIVKQ